MIRVLIGTHVPAPSVYIDELVHAELARNLLGGKWFMVRGAHVSVSFVYPILIAPAWLLHSSEHAYAVAKAIGAFVMVSSAVPVYLWSRRMMTHRFALLAVALTLLVPAFSLTSALMLETTFLPIFVLALFAFAVTLEHPSIRNQGLTLLTVVVASLTRFEGLILVPIIITGIALYWAGTRCRLRPFAPIALTIGCVAAAYLAWRLSVGKTIIPSSGVYEGFVQAHYTVTSVVSWFHANAAALVFATALVPCFALGYGVARGAQAPRTRPGRPRLRCGHDCGDSLVARIRVVLCELGAAGAEGALHVLRRAGCPDGAPALALSRGVPRASRRARSSRSG